MNSRFFIALAVLCVILFPHSVAQPQAQRTARAQPVEAVRAALHPWLLAVEGLLSKTRDAEVGLYLQVLRNAALMAPSDETGPAVLAQRVLSPPPDTARPWIGVIVIDSHKRLPPGRWQQLASTSDFAAEYHDDTNTIYLRSDIPQIPVMRGLLVIHEMRHWWQARHGATANNPDSRSSKEVDAYQTEFRVLDALQLPKYRDLLLSERLRIRRLLADPKQPPIEPDLSNPLLEQTFGRFQNQLAKQMAAAEIALRASFAELDTLQRDLALSRKVDLLPRLGYP